MQTTSSLKGEKVYHKL